jgi:hypothetical protein
MFSVHVVATPFSITRVANTPGSGYGAEASYPTDMKRDVAFSAGTFSTQLFSLNTVNQFLAFNFATVVFRGANDDSGITANELDNLGMIAKIIFVSPVGTNDAPHTRVHSLPR